MLADKLCLQGRATPQSAPRRANMGSFERCSSLTGKTKATCRTLSKKNGKQKSLPECPFARVVQIMTGVKFSLDVQADLIR